MIHGPIQVAVVRHFPRKMATEFCCRAVLVGLSSPPPPPRDALEGGGVPPPPPMAPSPCSATVPLTPSAGFNGISLGDSQNMPTSWVLALFGKFCFHVQTCRHGGGGVCVYFLKSARKHHFRNVWVVGGVTFFSVAQHIGRCTQTWHCTVHPFLF